MKAYRTWTINNRGKLQGSWNGVWESIHARSHKKPDAKNDCGLYAWKYLYKAIRDLNIDNANAEVLGMVELGGTIQEHSDGRLRAEYASVKCLFSADDFNVASLSGFGVPVYKLSDLLNCGLDNLDIPKPFIPIARSEYKVVEVKERKSNSFFANIVWNPYTYTTATLDE